ncbi:hypothetical protein EJ02DRAFT_482129 [Clathrospora elynae]|uniref:Uncharacterized protein n=1 Tax=Clathrospora elynae TaxID=706981 RepID=A0A6A5SCE6_9PLEO|nr:hypothetical protein EJ02DRAFT_482129 [Clathrospora elynae]
MPNQSGVLRCEYCNDTFLRNGHLQRHLLRHSGVKSFACKVCTKPFPRNDTLLRHEATHRQRDSQQNNDRRVLRACVPCVKAKQRCYGGDPCARCEQRRSTCEYGSVQRQNSISSVSQTSSLPPSGGLSGIFAGQDPTMSPPPFPTVPESASTSIEPNPRAPISLLPTHLSVTTSLSDSLSEDADSTSWPGLLPLPDSISTDESGMFADYLPHDMRSADEMTPNFGFPFVWMMQSFESPSRTPYTLGQGISNLCMPNDGSLAALETTGCADFMGSVPESRTTVDSSEARTRGNLDATHTPPANVCPSFPMLQEDELQGAGAELFGYVSKIPGKAYTALCAFYISERGYDDLSFPDCRLLHAFVELYFEYFDPHLPFLHPMRMETDDLSWILLTAVAAIGSQYSEVRDAFRFTAVLQNLLRRATQTNNLQTTAKLSETSLVQSVLLRDVGLIFSGSVSDQTVLQQEKSMLISLCRGLATPTDFHDADESTIDQDLDHGWLAWLQGEEVVRLVHCVYIMECFQLVFFDLRPLFMLKDFTQRLPCNGNTWRCRSARHWSETKQKGSPDSRTRRSGSFSTRSSILSLYADERAILDHMQSSRRLKSLITSEPGMGLQEQDKYSARRKLLFFGASKDDITFLDAVIDDAILSKSFPHPEIECSGQDPIVHVIAILREIPLRMIYASVGWQASGAEMQRFRERLKEYLQCNQSTARTCLWHAAQIYSSSRSLRYPAYYSSLSFAIAVSYILLYDQIVRCPAPQEALLRLDKGVVNPDIDAWTRCAQDFRAHITGIGILDSAESSHRLLVDAEKALRSQRPWRSMAQALAHCFSQMSKGQKPNIG